MFDFFSSLHICVTNPGLDIQLPEVFFHSVGRLFTQLFPVQKLFNFISVASCAMGILFRKSFAIPICLSALIILSSGGARGWDLMLWSLIHLELSFVQDSR